MADTGSEVAESTTRDVLDAAERLLERRFLWGREPTGQAARVREAPGDTLDGWPYDESYDDVTYEPREDEPATEAAEGRARDRSGTADAPGAEAGMEASTLTFANHSDQPSLDELHARAYAAGMRGLGVDAEYRRVAGEDGARHLVAVAYPASERDRFLDASTVCLHDAGALADMAHEDPYAHDAALLEATRARLSAHGTERTEGDAPGRDGEAPQDRPLDAEAYLALDARERARIAPERIPADAFGREGLAQSAAAHRAAATTLMRVRERERNRAHAVPDVRERGSR